MPGATCPTPKVNTHPRSLSPQQHSHRSSVECLPVNSHSSSSLPPLSFHHLTLLHRHHRHLLPASSSPVSLLSALGDPLSIASDRRKCIDIHRRHTLTSVYKRTVVTHIARCVSHVDFCPKSHVLLSFRNIRGVMRDH